MSVSVCVCVLSLLGVRNRWLLLASGEWGVFLGKLTAFLCSCSVVMRSAFNIHCAATAYACLHTTCDT